jgi:hypothetical protein
MSGLAAFQSATTCVAKAISSGFDDGQKVIVVWAAATVSRAAASAAVRRRIMATSWWWDGSGRGLVVGACGPPSPSP